MSTTLNLPLWQCSSPPSVPDCSEELDDIIKRLASGDTELEPDIPQDNGISESVNKYVFNNNVNETFQCVEKCHESETSCYSGSILKGSVCPEPKNENENIKKIQIENKSCAILLSKSESSVGREEGERSERVERQQHELISSSMEINTSDVTESRDLCELGPQNDCFNSKDSKIKRLRTVSCSTSSSTCSAGSYSRRKHHKHKHHRRKSPESEIPKTPKVNPIFLWVRQEDTRILEVLCEDYDHRNRIRLAKTPHGWRAIPKTERFSAAIIPKVSKDVQPKVKKKGRKSRKRRKLRKSRDEAPKTENYDLPELKECSVSLTREEYKRETSEDSDDTLSMSHSTDRCEELDTKEEKCDVKVEDVESGGERLGAEVADVVRRLPKSISCEFQTMKQIGLKRSHSCELDTKLDDHERKEIKSKAPKISVRSFLSGNVCAKSEPEEETKNGGVTSMNAEEVDEIINQNHSDPNILDMTEQGSDFNDTDCDELGQLLKDIPDLEFDDEESTLPKDLTIPKTKQEETKPKTKLPILPANISTLVTVTSSNKPPEPLTAPLPEVTITPIPNPKPAHQQKPQNKFLESLLSSPRLIKPERDEITITRTSRPVDDKRSALKSEGEPKVKKLKLEDITLKSLLSKHQADVKVKTNDLEKKVKKNESEIECTKSRLQELLTDCTAVDPIQQLKQVLSELSVPDPLLVPRARLPALVASPASEIPRLLNLRSDKQVEEKPCLPLTDPDMLVVSLAHLQSLLSCKPEGKKCSDAEELEAYQKSLEAFLEWQRYQTQLMEAQLKNSQHGPGLTPVDIDVATATALNQMLWLPYLNQLEAATCGNNRDFMSALNSMFPTPVPPHVNTNHFQQSSPFLTPTSPLEIEAQMKTLAMWQEAVMSQQNRKQTPQLKIPTAPPPSAQRKAQQHSRTSPINIQQSKNLQQQQQQKQNYNRFEQQFKTQYNYENFQLQQNMMRQQAEYQRKQKQQYQRQMDLQQQQQQQQQQKHIEQQKHLEQQKEIERRQFLQEQQLLQFQQYQQQYDQFYHDEQNKQFKQDPSVDKKPPGGIYVKPLSNLVEQPIKKNVKKNSSWLQFEEDIKKNAEITNQMALRWQQFEEEMRKSQIQISKNQKKVIKTESNEPWINFDEQKLLEQPPKLETPDTPSTTPEQPKLKVKNLVDPSMSPPKLIKPIDPTQLMSPPEELKEDPHATLWHPLFGSNQNKNPSYNSPYRWTTVTVNGE